MVSTPAVAVLEIVRALGISLRHPAGASNGGHPASSGSHHLLRGIGGWEWAWGLVCKVSPPTFSWRSWFSASKP